MILRRLDIDAARFVAAHMRESDRREIAALRSGERMKVLPEEAVATGPCAWAAGLGGEPIACIGVYEMWAGVWNAWMFATDKFDKIGLPLTRFVRRGIIPAVKGEGAHRVQALSIEGHDFAHRWLETLGARREAVLGQYGRGGEDFIVYRWARDEV